MIRSRNIEVDKAFVNGAAKIIAPSVSAKKGTVTNKTGNYTVLASEFDSIFTTTTGVVTLTLPKAASVAGKGLRVAPLATFAITLTPATGEKIFLNGSGVASKYCLLAGVVGNFIEIYSDGTDYIVTNYSGVVTKEA